jgi:hypothetical protein
MSFSWQGLFEVAEVKNYVSIEKQQSWSSQIKDKDEKKMLKLSLRILRNVLTTDQYFLIHKMPT